jgi:hypothetical protein
MNKKKRKTLLALSFKKRPPDIMLSEVNQAQKEKGCMFSLICGRQTQYKYQQYYEKQVTLRGGH